MTTSTTAVVRSDVFQEESRGLVPAAPGRSEPAGRKTPAGMSNRAARWWFLALMAFAAVVSCQNLGGGARFEPTDCWVAQTAREMQEAGEWLMPRFSGETRLQKSPGPYWAVMLAARLRGTPVDEAAARLPNAIAAVLLVAVVFWMTRMTAGNRAAVFGGFACASSVVVLYWSHRGASDLGLASLVALSLAALYAAVEEPAGSRRRGGLWCLGGLAAGLGMLYKLPMPLACVGLPMLLHVVIHRRWRALWTPWLAVAFGLFLLPWLPWVVAVVLREPAAWFKWRVEFLDRFTGDLPNVAGQRAWFFHFMYLVPAAIYTLPYSLSVPAGLWRALRPQREGLNPSAARFAVIWFVGLLAFFTASAGKEFRYLLPAVPPLFVLLGVELSRLFDPGRDRNERLVRLAVRAIWLGLPVAMAGGAYGLWEWNRHNGGLFSAAELWSAYLPAAAALTVGFALAAGLYRARRANASFAVLAGGMTLGWLWIWARLMPMVAGEAPFIEFARLVRDRLSPEQVATMRFIGSQDARIVWYGDLRMPRILDQLELLERQQGRRSLQNEERLVGQEMVRRLGGNEPVLMMSARSDYVRFLLEAPRVLAQTGQDMPPVHLWLQTPARHPKKSHFVVFGNRPPASGPVALEPPSQLLLENDRSTRPHAAE